MFFTNYFQTFNPREIIIILLRNFIIKLVYNGKLNDNYIIVLNITTIPKFNKNRVELNNGTK